MPDIRRSRGRRSGGGCPVDPDRTLEARGHRAEALKRIEPAARLLRIEEAGTRSECCLYNGHALQKANSRSEAAEALRGLVDAIVLVPAGNGLRIELKGNLAARLSAARYAKRSPEGDLSLQVALVAGAGFEPATFGL